MVSGVRIRGPFTGPSGYDHHVREFARGLWDLSVPVELRNLDDWGPVQLPRNLRDPWFEKLDKPVDARSTVHFSFPSQVTPDAGRLDINFTMFEATRIPAHWAAAHTASDLIVLPTEHSRRAWLESGVPESKLRLCPLGVRTDLHRPGVKPLPLTGRDGRPLASYAVRFLNVSELGARKNLDGLLVAWLRATSRHDDTVLILKVGCYNPGSLATFEAEVQAAELQAGKRLDEAAPVHFIYDLFPDADMPRLFAAATHYISLSFGEGWDLSMIEAAASGLSLIAPRHSAYLAYLDEDIATMISCREVPALDADGFWVSDLFEGANWWVPDGDEAVARIEEAVQRGPVSDARARQRMVERFTWKHAAQRLIEVLDEAEAMADRRPAR